MLQSDRLLLAIKEVEFTDMLSESKKYTEEELLDIIIDNPSFEEKLVQNDEYANIIEKFREGGLIE